MKKCISCGKEIDDNDTKCGQCGKEQHTQKQQPVQSIFMVGNKNTNQSSTSTHTNNKNSSRVNVFATGNNTIHKTNNTSNVIHKNPFGNLISASIQGNPANNTSTPTVQKIHKRKLIIQSFIKKLSKIRTIRRKTLYIAALIIVVVCGGYFLYRYFTAGSLYSNNNIYRSIVEIITGTGDESGFQGSAIIFSKDGLILTNNHVIEDENFGSSFNDIQVCILEEITAEPNCDYTADLIVRNPGEDLAILKIRNYDGENYINLFHGINTSKSQYLEKKIKVVGYPGLGGEKMTVTKGIIAGFDEYDDFKTDAEINHGNSGGGTFDENNTFIGVPYSAASEEGGKISYIISVFNIKKRFDNMLYKQPKNSIYSSEYFAEKNIRYNSYNIKKNSAESEKVINNFTWIENNKTKYSEVLKKINDILDIIPSSPLAYEYMGDVYYDLGQYDKALKMYNYSIELNPYVITANIGYGLTLIELERYSEAIDIYKDLIPIFEYDNESLSIIYNILGICYEALGEEELANEYYNKSTELGSALETGSENSDATQEVTTKDDSKANEVCQGIFGQYSYGDGTLSKNGDYNCYCKAGYKRESDADDSQCIKK